MSPHSLPRLCAHTQLQASSGPPSRHVILGALGQEEWERAAGEFYLLCSLTPGTAGIVPWCAQPGGDCLPPQVLGCMWQL